MQSLTSPCTPNSNLNPKTCPKQALSRVNSPFCPPQPADLAYSNSGLTLSIPNLGVQTAIVSVPRSEQSWDVSWLGEQIGYLGGTAFPTWAGNSVLTGHATNANGQDGPFARLGSLGWGDQIVIRAFGQAYIYEVRSVNRWTNPKDVAILTKHEDLPWVTLVTCSGYDEKNRYIPLAHSCARGPD